MPTNQNPHAGRRQHFHRGRRGPDRRGPDRRPPQAGHERGAGEHVDVEQIMGDIRAQISRRQGVELSNQQIQELAARRLEAILDPRTVKPALLDELRRSAGSHADLPSPDPQLTYTFEDRTMYESHNGLLRLIRRLLNPVLKLFFNPNPLIQALNIQTRMNKDASRREAERDRRQAEWNALHYGILQRIVTEVSRASIDAQNLSLRVESLAAKVDFNERRVRGLENTTSQSTPPSRVTEVSAPAPAAPGTPATESALSEGQSEGPRRRRRRRRGRRGTGLGPSEAIGTGAVTRGTAMLEGPESAGDAPEDLEASAVSLEDEGRAMPSGQHDASHETLALDPVVEERMPGEPIRPSPSSEPVSPVEAQDTTPAQRPPEPAFAEPSPAPDEPFPPAPVDRPDPGPADR